MYGVDLPINDIEPSTIYGIEIYGGAATLPPEYITGVAVGGSCGLIMIWTRTGGGEHPKSPPQQDVRAVMGRPVPPILGVRRNPTRVIMRPASDSAFPALMSSDVDRAVLQSRINVANPPPSPPPN